MQILEVQRRRLLVTLVSVLTLCICKNPVNTSVPFRSGWLFRSDRSRFLAQVRQHEFDLAKSQIAAKTREMEDETDAVWVERRQFIINVQISHFIRL